MEAENRLKIEYDEWLKLDKNEETRVEIQQYQNNLEELKLRLLDRIKFGTAGLRAKMGAGFALMNDLIIIQTTQGLLATCKKYDLKKGIVVGYDARHNSEKWAKIVATIFYNAGVPVYLFSNIVPTPFLAFGVTFLKTLCGVMITASHNPKNDNGYKLYWENGCQIIPPLDKEITDNILLNLIPDEKSWKYNDIIKHVKDPLEELSKAYYQRQLDCLSRNLNVEMKKKFRLVYTPMHGVGWDYAKKMLEKFGFDNIICVPKQVKPDPEFPTVPFPNPEEKGALCLAIETANDNNISLIAANDPDADRLAVAERYNGSWKIISGNEFGALLGWWIWSTNKLKSEKNDNFVMISSTVSSKILKSIADKEQFQFYETLTGFKWIGNKADEMKHKGKIVLFAFEEAIGYMCNSNILDKDGISALAVFTEMSAHLYAKGSTLTEQLAKIYEEYGYHVNNNGYLKSKSSELTKRMFTKLRNWNGSSQSYPEFCGDKKFKIIKIRDLTTGYYSYEEKDKLPSDLSNEMITFTFSNNCTLTIRASGTEPKIKYYSEIIQNHNDKCRTTDDLKLELDELIANVKKHFYQKDVFGFTE